jgi:hypothetical protein
VVAPFIEGDGAAFKKAHTAGDCDVDGVGDAALCENELPRTAPHRLKTELKKGSARRRILSGNEGNKKKNAKNELV